MLFNSYAFILLFVPAVLAIFYLLDRYGWGRGQRLWLLGASLFFYGWWNPVYLLLLVFSIVSNYVFGIAIFRSRRRKGVLLAAGASFNVLLLGYFKYADFFIENVNAVAGTEFVLPHVVLPLAISFFTFQQIAYLADARRGLADNRSLSEYALFVAFFPQLIAGPIVHHSEMMGQFADRKLSGLRWDNLARGIGLFVMGLVKKIFIADTLATCVSVGFSSPQDLTFAGAWVVSLSYTFQIYFDFSGYMDMATGVALMLNIKLPNNFDSPYKSLTIGEFWRRWHITLSRFLRDYIYIPLGGGRVGPSRTFANAVIVFLLGGLWHGAAWTFVVWGGLHGLGVGVQRIWSRFGVPLPRILAWMLTFVFVLVAWVVFRAESLGDAGSVLRAMVGLNGIVLPDALASMAPQLADIGFHFGGTFGHAGVDWVILSLTAGCFVLSLGFPTARAVVDEAAPTPLKAVAVAVVFSVCILLLNRPSEFIYFQF